MNYMIEGLDCASCASKIENKLNQNDKIQAAKLNFVTKVIEVDFNREIPEEERLDIVKSTVYAYEPHTKVFSMVEYEEHEHHLLEKKDLLIIAAGITLFILSFFIEAYSVPILIVAYLLVGWDVIYTALMNIKKGEVFDENFLMFIATLAAIYIGEYTEAVGVFIFYKIGEIFESYAIEKARGSIESAKESMIKHVSYVNPFGGNLITKAIEEIRVGDVIQMKAGERVMFDGTVISELADFDPSALTGESLPLAREMGESVLSGYINLGKPVQMKVQKVFSESTYSKIVELVNSASGNRSKTERMMTKFAKIYTPIVVAMAALIVAIPTIFFGGNLETWIYRGAIFLVVSCPCALVISVPLVYYIALGVASRNGVIIKGSKYLDLIRKIQHFVFDKTGTLTKGQFEISEIVGGSDVLGLAAMGESFSSHPIARAIVKSYDGQINEEEVKDLVEHTSRGIRYLYKGEEILLGNSRMMAMFSIPLENPEAEQTVVYVAKGGKLLGYIRLRDQVKPEAEGMLRSLSHQEVHILSGDHGGAVANVAKRLKIKNFKSEMMPEEKLEYIESLESVCFVGDGINDGPVMARADLGISMGHQGSDLAIEQSQIVILDDDIGKINFLMKLSHRVRTLVVQNIVLALGIKIAVMILGALGYSSMGMAIFADVGVAIIAILNAIRMNY